MSDYTASVDIAAPASAAWSVLTDFADYGAWSPMTPGVSGELSVGSAVRLTVRLHGLTMRQRLTITAIAPPHQLVWVLDIGLPWLIRAERTQTITAIRSDRCRYETTDRIRGLLAPVVELMMGRALRSGFARHSEAMSCRVEGLVSDRR
ncbi:MAG: SRPBCC domain-containing protein [Myxococcota bacterium]|nr:SRPBCC domain-containing protein [Myxococcota bacterium]